MKANTGDGSICSLRLCLVVSPVVVSPVVVSPVILPVLGLVFLCACSSRVAVVLSPGSSSPFSCFCGHYFSGLLSSSTLSISLHLDLGRMRFLHGGTLLMYKYLRFSSVPNGIAVPFSLPVSRKSRICVWFCIMLEPLWYQFDRS